MSRIIALGGYAGAGKDTVGQHLVSAHGFRRFAHADVLRDVLFELDPFVDGATRISAIGKSGQALLDDRLFGAEVRRISGLFADDLLPVELDVQPPALDHAQEMTVTLDPLVDGSTTVQGLVSELGWDGAKRHRVHGPEVRRLLQALGDVLRAAFGQDLLVHALIERVALAWAQDGVFDVVVTDARGDAETSTLVERGAEVWWVDRPGVGPANDHHTERPISTHLIDHVLNNDTTVAGLGAAVDDLLNRAGARVA